MDLLDFTSNGTIPEPSGRIKSTSYFLPLPSFSNSVNHRSHPWETSSCDTAFSKNIPLFTDSFPSSIRP